MCICIQRETKSTKGRISEFFTSLWKFQSISFWCLQALFQKLQHWRDVETLQTNKISWPSYATVTLREKLSSIFTGMKTCFFFFFLTYSRKHTGSVTFLVLFATHWMRSMGRVMTVQITHSIFNYVYDIIKSMSLYSVITSDNVWS